MARDELVLVFPIDILKTVGYFQGLNFEYAKYVNKIFSPDVAHFIHRKQAEKDHTKKQIIPYVLLVANDKFLFYVRGKKGNEKRLISNGSIGIGGHISLEDASIFHSTDSLIYDIYEAAVTREVNEELILNTTYEDHKIAVINDDSNNVGKVHFGIVHLWRLRGQNVQGRGHEISQLSFLTPEEIRYQKKASLENWSLICLDNINSILSDKIAHNK